MTNRLQCVFDVSQLTVDPTFVAAQRYPQARLTLQQQVSTIVTFTYVTALDQSNTQIVLYRMGPKSAVVGDRDTR